MSVNAKLSGLSELTRYHFRLKVSNANGSDTGEDRTFFTPLPVSIGEASISDVSSSSAQFSGQVNPGGADTTFRFEYGTSTSYGESVPVAEGDLGSGTGLEPLSVRVEGLQPETTYHVRIVATNLFGTVYGLDHTFTTQPGGGTFGLPDGRLWEMVSPPAKYGASIEPLPHEGYVEAAEDGNAITYVANGPLVNSSVGNPSPVWNTQILSRRGIDGWSSQDIVSPNSSIDENTGSHSEFSFFSPDLSQGLVEPTGETPLASEATERTVYVRDSNTGTYVPVVTAGNVSTGTKFGGKNSTEQVHGVTGTPNLSHVLIESPLALTNEGEQTNNGGYGEYIYEWTGNHLTLVSVLPDGTPSLGYLGGESGGSGNIRHAVSEDGSRVFWHAGSESGGSLYMRETVTGRTVRVDASEAGVAEPSEPKALFQIASATGSKAFFLDEQPLTSDSKLAPPAGTGGNPRDLYVYDTESKTLKDLTVDHAGSEPANVQQMVLGASEDGSIVYFVATGVLANGAQAGKYNLYGVSETGSTWSEPRFIAALSGKDSPTWGEGGIENGNGYSGPASEVSPDGRFLTFMSNQGLKTVNWPQGYDNRDALGGVPDEEVFVYDESSNQLTCVSCDPTGARPTGIFDEGNLNENGGLLSDREDTWESDWLAADIPAWDTTHAIPERWPYQSRYLSDEGRLFFNSFDSLVAQDTNGKADVYEYEPGHVGSCERPDGCVSLISSGTSGEESAFLDASGMGPGGHESEDVFFITQAKLTSQDYDMSFDVYDAHVCSSAAPCSSTPVAPPECSSGDSCKAAPSLQPEIFGPAPSATFSGTGDIVGSHVPSVKEKSLTTGQKLARALRACRAKKSQKSRKACERQVRKRYRSKRSRSTKKTKQAKTTKKGNG